MGIAEASQNSVVMSEKLREMRSAHEIFAEVLNQKSLIAERLLELPKMKGRRLHEIH
jgi:hypothetical protein